MGAHRTKIAAKCQNPACGGTFWERPYYVRTGRRKYCGRSCYTATRPSGFRRSSETAYDHKLRSIAKHPEKHACRRLFENARRRGDIMPEPCCLCGENAEAHHWDYAKPYDVFWLCRTHHIAVHRGRFVLLLPSTPFMPAVESPPQALAVAA